MSTLPSIPVKEAVTLTSNWRTYYAALSTEANPAQPISPNSPEVFRGFRIPLEDLEKIIAVAREYNEKNASPINSVRAYLVKDTPDIRHNKDIHLILVPVVGGKEMQAGLSPFGTDLLGPKGVEDETDTFIYDYTSPCPAQCDTESILYSNEF